MKQADAIKLASVEQPEYRDKDIPEDLPMDSMVKGRETTNLELWTHYGYTVSMK